MVTQTAAKAPVSAAQNVVLDVLMRAVASSVPRAGLALLVHLLNSETPATSWRRMQPRDAATLCRQAGICAETGKRVLHALIRAGILEERPSQSGRGRDVRVLITSPATDATTIRQARHEQ